MIETFFQLFEGPFPRFLPTELGLIRLVWSEGAPTLFKRRTYDVQVVDVSFTQPVLTAKVQVANGLGIKPHEIGCQGVNGHAVCAGNGNMPVHSVSGDRPISLHGRKAVQDTQVRWDDADKLVKKKM